MEGGQPVGERRVAGITAPGYERVADAFDENLTEHGEVGAAFCAYVRGQQVVDLWGGVADPQSGRPWAEDTLQVIFSGTKGLIAVCILILTERGQLDLDARVARYWPEFAAAGKESVLVRHVVSHTAGLPGIRRREVTRSEMLDGQLMASLLADEVPIWEPGSVLCYHPLTYGWLCGELMRRIDGRSAGRFFAEEVAQPLGLELWIGLPAAEEARVAVLQPCLTWGQAAQNNPDEVAADPVLRAVWGNPPFLLRDEIWRWNTTPVRNAEIPAANAVGTARSVARLYGCLASGGELDGVRLLSRGTLENGRRLLSSGIDPLQKLPFAFAAGFELQSTRSTLGPPADAFGHGGAGGSMHGAWPSQQAGFSYAMNELRDDEVEERSSRLLGALFRAIDSR
jgi:CubicO group peptidase (beta-lactamase class C family)